MPRRRSRSCAPNATARCATPRRRTASGGACSGTAIRGLIKDIIEAEAPTAPLSDAEIARQLATQGLQVARRTVTKYRQLLKIEAVERRRRHAPS